MKISLKMLLSTVVVMALALGLSGYFLSITCLRPRLRAKWGRRPMRTVS